MLETLLKNWQPVAAGLGFAVFFLWESVSPFFPRGPRFKHVSRNLIVAIINLVILAAVFGGITVSIAEYAGRQRAGLLYSLPVSTTVRAILAFLILDAWTYWWHRANHRVPFLWRFHRMHHSDPEMDVSTATRFHVGEITMSSIIRLGLIPLLGLPLISLLMYDLVLLASTQFHHANLALPGWADRTLRAVIVTPFVHKIHHSHLQPETDSNYSSFLTVWDRLFGSFRLRDDYNSIRFGVDGLEGPEQQTIKGLLLTPLR